MKKLAVVLLLVAAGCRRQAVVTSAPPAGAPGAATPREAVQKFLASAKAQDLQAMSLVWGSAAGPAHSTMNQAELEQREIYLMRCLRHDTYSILTDTPGLSGECVFTLEVRRGAVAPRADFTATRGPKDRWYVRTLELEKLNPICVAK